MELKLLLRPQGGIGLEGWLGEEERVMLASKS